MRVRVYIKYIYTHATSKDKTKYLKWEKRSSHQYSGSHVSSSLYRNDDDDQSAQYQTPWFRHTNSMLFISLEWFYDFSLPVCFCYLNIALVFMAVAAQVIKKLDFYIIYHSITYDNGRPFYNFIIILLYFCFCVYSFCVLSQISSNIMQRHITVNNLCERKYICIIWITSNFKNLQ